MIVLGKFWFTKRGSSYINDINNWMPFTIDSIRDLSVVIRPIEVPIISTNQIIFEILIFRDG